MRWVASGADAQQAALAECRTRGGGSGCVVRAWGCNEPVVEEGPNRDRAARRRIRQGLAAGGFDPGGADGLLGRRTRAAIRRWQSSRGARATGYLDRESAEALRTAGGAGSAVTPVAPFPNGMFRALAGAAGGVAFARWPARSGGHTRERGGVAGACGTLVSGGAAPAFGTAAGRDAGRRSGEVFRDCAECPEMVVLADGNLTMGRYEVTIGQYRAVASATGGGVGEGCSTPGSDLWGAPRLRFGEVDDLPAAVRFRAPRFGGSAVRRARRPEPRSRGGPAPSGRRSAGRSGGGRQHPEQRRRLRPAERRRDLVSAARRRPRTRRPGDADGAAHDAARGRGRTLRGTAAATADRRALARKPRILLLDEATSALDNHTQSVVQDSLGKLNITRIVIADCAGAGSCTSCSRACAGVESAMTSAAQLAATSEECPHPIIAAHPESDQGFQ